ncbi:MAG: hypothetical protein ABI551_14460 [Polyangiaceae bacterium]
MGKRRRFPWFWVYLFTACSSGCSGCCDCFGCDCHEDGGCYNGGGGGGCNPDLCGGDGGTCFDFGSGDSGGCGLLGCGDGAPPSVTPVRLASLVAPTALACDDIELFVVDNGDLLRFDVPYGSPPTLLASGVVNVGNIESDGLYVYWAGTWSGGPSDGGADAGVDADVDAGDASDAGDAGNAGNLGPPGLFRVPITGESVERIAALDPLPTLVGDGSRLFVRARSDDAGASMLGSIDLGVDAGFVPLAAVSGNTENLHAFALGSTGLVALDANDVVAVLTDGGKSVLATGEAARSLLGTSSGFVDVIASDAGYQVVLENGLNVAGAHAITALAARGDRLFVGSESAIDVHVASQLLYGPRSVATMGTVPRVLASDDGSVYWITAGPDAALYQAPLP